MLGENVAAFMLRNGMCLRLPVYAGDGGLSVRSIAVEDVDL